MAKKPLLFIGIIMLLIGILIRKSTELDLVGLLIILTGVTLKCIYIIGKIKNGAYKPGLEVLFLIIGLFLFLGGIYLRNNNLDLLFVPAMFFIITGLILKIVFIVLFIKKLKDSKRIKDPLVKIDID